MKKVYILLLLGIFMTGCMKDEAYEDSQKKGIERMQTETGVKKEIIPIVENKPGCCRVCITGTACGDDCISEKAKCIEPKGCACNK